MSENGNPGSSLVQFSEAELFDAIRTLSPKRNTTVATNIGALGEAQLLHFGIVAETELGEVFPDIPRGIYSCQGGLESMSHLMQQGIATLSQEGKAAYFNAKKYCVFSWSSC